MQATRRSLLSTMTGLAGFGLAGATLAACGAGQKTAPSSSAESKEPVTVAIAAGGWVTDVDKEIHRKVWKAFEGAHPNVTLDINEIAFDTDKFLTVVAGGTPPDAAYIHPNNLPSVAAPGAYQSLDEYVKRDKSVDLKTVFPKVLEFHKFKGALYQLPYHSGPSMIYYNKTLFQRLGVKTPEQYDQAGQWQWKTGWMEAVRLLTQNQNGGDTYGFDGRSGIAFVNVPIWANGGEILSPDLTQTLLNSAQATEGIQYYADMWVKLQGTHPSGDWKNFVQGTTGMVFGFRGMGPLMRTIKDFEVGMWHNPGGPAGKITRSGPSGYGVVTGAKHADWGWEFCKNYIGPVAQGILFSAGFNVPMTNRKEDMDAFRKDLAPWEKEDVYMEAQTTRLRPMAPLPVKWLDFNTVWNREWNLIKSGQKTAQQSMTAVKPEIDALLKQG